MKQFIKFIFIFYFLSFGIVFSQNDGKFNKRGPFKQKLGGGFKTEYNVEFENGFTVTGGSVSFSGTVTFTGTSALWAADGDTVRIDPGTALNIFDIEVNNSPVLVIDSTGHFGVNQEPVNAPLEVQSSQTGQYAFRVNPSDNPSSALFNVFEGGGNAATVYMSDGSDDFFFALTAGGNSYFKSGNFGFGTDTFDGSVNNSLAVGNGTAPSAGTANQSYLYAKDVTASSEMHVMDEAGNETQISPHDPETGKWIFYSKNTKTGRILRVEMEDLIFDLAKEMSKKTGKKYIYESRSIEER